MNEYTFVTKCKHEGTIKPVKSSGKHAGKWFCRVKGAKVDALGMNVKTLYTAPFVGAAKASIAKFLSITVDTVEVTVSPSRAHVMNTPTDQHKSAARSNSNEFDVGNDDEFANFDLNAAVSSAKKQNPFKKPPPNLYRKQCSNDHEAKDAYQQRDPTSNYKSTTPAATQHDPCRDLESLRAEKDRINKDIYSARQNAECMRLENERMVKETNEARDERARLKGQIRAIREEHEKLQEKQQEYTAMKEKYEIEVKELDEERSKLKGQVRALQERRDDLKSQEAQREKHEKELKELGTGRDKLKGQIRALQEQYDQLKGDVKSATQKKDCVEREARDALAKKERYEKEAKTLKKALESHRVQLESVANKQEASSQAPGESEPPTKKRKAGKQVKSGTIVKSMKVAELKEEAVARGVDVKELTSMNKNAILDMLVVGSQCIIKTTEWGEIVRLRKTFADERQKAEQLEMQRQEEIYRHEQQKRQEQEKRQQEQREKNRANEISKQGELHSHCVPKVHGCKLALTKDLLFHGSPREYSAQCSTCRNCFRVEYTCEKCDFDVCFECFKEKTMTAAEKKAEAKRKAAIKKEREAAAAERRRLQEEEEERHRKKWDPKTQFAEEIVNPLDKNKDPDGNAMKGFTVWCSDGYGYDGWHSYEGPPEKEFDTTYTTKKEANERARYLFFWKNPWGLEPEEVTDNQYIDKTTKDGMVTYTVTPDDSTTWTVSVVPDAAFAYLDKSSRQRHHHDVEYKSASSFGYVSGSCY